MWTVTMQWLRLGTGTSRGSQFFDSWVSKCKKGISFFKFFVICFLFQPLRLVTVFTFTLDAMRLIRHSSHAFISKNPQTRGHRELKLRVLKKIYSF